MLVSHVLVPPAMEAVLSAPQCQVQAFLAAGHACMVTGYEEYDSISQQYQVPIVVTGFEPLDLLEGVLMLVAQLENGRTDVENQYTRAVHKEGNLQAQARVAEVFEVTDRAWRGIGEIRGSGLRLRDHYRVMDAESRFNLKLEDAEESSECIAGLVLQGLRKPYDCPAFGTSCTPDTPLGAPMVSSEGACAAYFHFGRRKDDVDSVVSVAVASH
jgi:hydrogenase expression/formation protein HypD